MNKERVKKAEDFLALHHDPKLLVLPNIWDPLGAQMLAGMGFPAVATASAAVAYSLGYDDGQKISFPTMLEAIRRIAASVDVPVTADIEAGYAESPDEVAENIRQVIVAGAVGINLEDSIPGVGALHPIDFQCERIRAVRGMADAEGVPLVINARIDVFNRDAYGSHAGNLEDTTRRANAYIEAGADCIYPITVGDMKTLNAIREEVGAPINVYAAKGTASMRELEDAGISRLSLGPGLLKAGLTTMKQVAQELQNYGSYGLFTTNVISSAEITGYVSSEKM